MEEFTVRMREIAHSFAQPLKDQGKKLRNSVAPDRKPPTDDPVAEEIENLAESNSNSKA